MPSNASKTMKNFCNKILRPLLQSFGRISSKHDYTKEQRNDTKTFTAKMRGEALFIKIALQEKPNTKNVLSRSYYTNTYKNNPTTRKPLEKNKKQLRKSLKSVLTLYNFPS